MGKVFVFTSGRGGTGKTTVAVNVAYCLEKNDKKVLLIDGDYTYGSLDESLNMSDRIVYHIQDIIDGNCRIIEALYPSGDKGNVFLLASAKSTAVSRLTAAQVHKLLSLFKTQFDYVLVDLPAPVTETEMAYVQASDGLILVERPEIVDVHAVKRLLSFLPEGTEKKTKLVVNLTRKDLVKYKDQMSVPEFTDLMDLDLLCAIPDDDDILVGSSHAEPVFDIHSAACRGFSEAAQQIMVME